MPSNGLDLNKEFFNMIVEQGRENAKEINKMHADVVILGEKVSNTTARLEHVCKSFDRTADTLSQFVIQQTSLAEKFMIIPELIDDVRTLKLQISEGKASMFSKRVTYILTGSMVSIAILFEIFSTFSISRIFS